MSSGDTLLRGRAAFRTQAWSEAYANLAAADRQAPLAAEDLELLATSAYLTGADHASIDVWVRAYEEWLRTANPRRAARCTFWMILELLAGGEWARANGWLATARRLLDDDVGDCPERGLFGIVIARGLLKEGDEAAALAVSAEANALADRFDDRDLKAVGRLGLGVAHARRGDARHAIALFDEAMVAATAEGVSPLTVGVVYCAVIEACFEVLDLGRAREWTATLAHWCGAQPDLVPFRGQCLVHRAETMRLCGAWSTAIHEAEEACRRASEATNAEASEPARETRRGYPLGAAFYEQAEIWRLRGRFVEANDAYRNASLHGRSPEPGLALLRLAEGRTDAAVATIRRLIEQPQRRWARLNVLAAATEILIAAGDLEAAHGAVQELIALAADFPTPVVRAVAAHATGALLLAREEPRAALPELRRAWMEWQELEVPFEAARVRVLMGLACRALGDEEAGQLELEAARHVFLRLDAASEIARIDQLLTKPSASGGTRLTSRELQVIRLLAAGKTNRAIARKLTISERTVDRHVSNILTKLNLPSRSAATAYAYQHNLV